MRQVKLCPKCGHISYWDSYFRCYCCTYDVCGYMEQVRGGCEWCNGDLKLLANGKTSVVIKDGKLKLLVGNKVVDAREIKRCPVCEREI